MEISIGSITGIRVTEIEEYDLDDEEEWEAGDARFYRTLTIETTSGEIEFELEAETEEALEIEEEEDEEDEEEEE